MSEIAAQFFSPWDPAPPFATPPVDAKRADVLHKLAQFAVKNGASFVELIKDKQKNNPEYQFLFGGQDSDYYRWVLYCRCHNLPSDQPLPVPQPQLLSHQPAEVQVPSVEVLLQQTLATCTPEVRDGFSQVLAALSGSKASSSQLALGSRPASIACLRQLHGTQKNQSFDIKHIHGVNRSQSSKASNGLWHAFHMHQEWQQH